MSQFSFSQRDFPPTPVIEIIMVSTELGKSTDALMATIDTGADGSFAPLSLLEKISAPVGKARRARSLWGEFQVFATFIVDVRVGDVTFPGISVVGYDGEEVILGRDVLNKLRLLLDGPAEITEILGAKQKRK